MLFLSKSPNEFGTMRPFSASLLVALLLSFVLLPNALERAFGAPSPKIKLGAAGNAGSDMPSEKTNATPETKQPETVRSSRSLVLVASLTVFVLSIFVGFEIIAKVPPTLHTPLMSGSNAISGITVVGAIIAAGYEETGVGSLFGLVAIVLAMINVVGGFVVTHRMLLMFKKR
jgi:NAD(P) transhydrogenase subunit alpha